MFRSTSLALLLMLGGCVGAQLEYAAAPDDASTEETPDAQATPSDRREAPARPAEPAPVWLDPGALAAFALSAESAGFTPQRLGEQELYLPLEAHFQHNSAALLPTSAPALEALRRLLDQDPRISALRVAVHSDSRGSSEYNLRLTAARALAIAQWLVQRGVACARVEAVGYGEGHPLESNQTAGGSARNRRIELWVVGVDGRTRTQRDGLVLGSACDPSADPDQLLHPAPDL